MKQVKLGQKIIAYTGRCIGIVIQSTTWEGEVVKVNKKSIRVRLTESVSMFGNKVISHQVCMSDVQTFRFAKTLSNGKDYYKSEGGVYGGIEI